MSAAAAFEAMARRIELIDGKEFAGAVVIVPPGEDAAAIVYLSQDPSPVVAQFWASLQARVQHAAAEAQEAEQVGGQWGRR